MVYSSVHTEDRQDGALTGRAGPCVQDRIQRKNSTGTLCHEAAAHVRSALDSSAQPAPQSKHYRASATKQKHDNPDNAQP